MRRNLTNTALLFAYPGSHSPVSHDSPGAGAQSFRTPRLILWWIVPLLLLAGPAQPWGAKGHRVVAMVASERLSPEARRAVQDLLGSESLVEVSTWADEIRRYRRETGQWHYINVPIEARNPDILSFCPPGGCVVSKIDDFRSVLTNPREKPANRRDALKFLIHLVADLHQPLHVGDRNDKGGNRTQVVYFQTPANLHSVWDTEILQRMEEEAALASGLCRIVRSGWERGTTADWAAESHAVAREAAYKHLSRKVGAHYQRQAETAVRVQLAKAGVRLAAMLNRVWEQ
ncbi:MAG: S1/P1 nuclease [Bryobacteraceae bacterium]|nr:S1/P1 nuclease [Bryobacterales bacterium]NUN01594.1 S1/P1 nuclease [Bryobacteraceae bacterium]